MLVYGYGRSDSPPLQAALSRTIQAAATVAPDVAAAAIGEVSLGAARPRCQSFAFQRCMHCFCGHMLSKCA